MRRDVDVAGYDRARGGRREHVRDHRRGQMVNGAEPPPSLAPLRRSADRLGAPGEGGTRSLWAYYYRMAPSYGIFDDAKKRDFAERMSGTAVGEIGQSKRSIRSWVRAARDAVASGDEYRISETARNVFADIPGEVADVPELRSIYEHLGQANVAGQHMEGALGKGDRKEYGDSRREFQSILANIDAETRDWEREAA